MVAYKLSAGHIIYCDAAAGTHNWMLYGTDWYNEASFGDFMIRCYWQPDSSGVVRPSWGGVKELYR